MLSFRNIDYQSWLLETPKYTTFRVNRLKTFETAKLQNFLSGQKEELNSSQIPNYYFLQPDCLVVEQWPADIHFERTENEVVVDALCAAAVLKGAHVFAPGILSLPSSCHKGERIDIYGDLDGQCKRGLKVKYSGRKIYVGTGYLQMLRSDLFDNGVQPSGIGVQTLLPASRLPVINESIGAEGELLLQNLPSIVCGWVVNAEPGEIILDMCSAPGNKATHLAEMSYNKANIIAIDKTQKKVNKIRENCKIQEINCISCYTYDSTKCWSQEVREYNGSPPFPSNTFDKVLLDAPCSGLGQRPQLLNKMSTKMLQSYKFVQRKLFDAAVNVLKNGGCLVYSTCTVTLDENEGMVAWVLQKFPCLKLVPSEPLLGGPGLPNCGLTDEQRLMVQRFGPENDPQRVVDHIYKDTIGFFIAKFVKV